MLFKVKLTYDVYIAPPLYVAVFCVKFEFSIVKLPSSWSIAPPNSDVELLNVEFIILTLVIESKNRLLPFLAELIFVNSEFVIVSSYISVDFSLKYVLAPIAPTVFLDVKLVNLELLIVAFEYEACIAVE